MLRLAPRLAAVLLAATFGAAPLTLAAQQAPATEWATVDAALGRAGAVLPGGVRKYSFPRGDLHVILDGVTLRPALALGSWVAFRDAGRGASLVMGDLVLTMDEVPAVMKALQRGGVEQSALHNHLLNETPRVMYMHIHAHGPAARIAGTIRSALEQTHTPLGPSPAPAPPSAIDLDSAGVSAALRMAGKANGGVLQFSVPRREVVREASMEVPATMGTATAINFQPTGGGKAAVTGDFVLRANEVNAVIRTLEDGGIAVTAVHNHMLDESPRLFFLHFWANADAATLARTLQEAVARTQSQRAGHE